jgi:hypothetical protein
MTALLDAGVQLIQVILLVALVAQNFAVSSRLRDIEEKLNR